MEIILAPLLLAGSYLTLFLLCGGPLLIIVLVLRSIVRAAVRPRPVYSGTRSTRPIPSTTGGPDSGDDGGGSWSWGRSDDERQRDNDDDKRACDTSSPVESYSSTIDSYSISSDSDCSSDSDSGGGDGGDGGD